MSEVSILMLRPKLVPHAKVTYISYSGLSVNEKMVEIVAASKKKDK